MKETEATPTIVERLNALRLTAFSAGGFSTPETKTYYSELSKAFQNGELADAAEVLRLQSELNTALERVKVLEDELQKIMIGGNHLGLIIGADHPVYTASFDDAREYYLNLGRNEEYEAWCCWKNIMEARDILQSSGGK